MSDLENTNAAVEALLREKHMVALLKERIAVLEGQLASGAGDVIETLGAHSRRPGCFGRERGCEMTPTYIGITGRAGAGKSTLAAGLLFRSFTYWRQSTEIRSLADPLKRICQEVFGWERHRLYGPSEARNEPDPAWDGLTARRALQQLGTEWGRALHPDVWVRYLLRQPRNGYVVIVPDVRFDNEARALREAGGLIIRVVADERRPPAPDAHASEAGVSDALIDLTVHNDREDNGAAMVEAVLAVLRGPGLIPRGGRT